MRFQTGHGKSWAWISLTSKASVTFLSVIISRSSLSCLVAKPSWGSLKDCLIDLFSNEGFPKEIISDNGSPFNSQEFADYLSSHGVKHTSSPHYPQSNGFIERHIQTVKNLLYKEMDAGTRSFQEVLSELRATKDRKWLALPSRDTSWKIFNYRRASDSGSCQGQSSARRQADQRRTDVTRWCLKTLAGALEEPGSHLRPRGPDFPHI